MVNTLLRERRAAATAAPSVAVCTALSAFGDAIALIDPAARVVRWTSPAWHRLPPQVGVGSLAAPARCSG
jgi:hypothetical protein